jgi:S1-C subfamily serine protease
MPYAAVGSFRDPTKAHPVWVYLADGREGLGKVVWTAQPPLDVAVVALDVKDAPPTVPVSDRAEEVHVGDGVLVVPNPMRRGWLLHSGSVSKREPHATPAGRYSLLYTDAPLQPGDSGTGLFDSQGRLVGINTWASRDVSRPVGISLPSEALAEVLDRLRNPSGPEGGR